MYFCFRVLYFIKYKKTITFLITLSMLVEPGLYFLYFCEVWGVCSMLTDVNSKCTCMYLPVQYCSILLQGTIVLCKNVKCNQGLLYARKRHSSASSGNRATRTFRLSSIHVMVLLEWSVLPIEQGMAAATKETTRENSDRVDMDASANKFPRMADRCKVCLTTQDRPYFVTQ